jgi:hypothetical protein
MVCDVGRDGTWCLVVKLNLTVEVVNLIWVGGFAWGSEWIPLAEYFKNCVLGLCVVGPGVESALSLSYLAVVMLGSPTRALT